MSQRFRVKKLTKSGRHSWPPRPSSHSFSLCARRSTFRVWVKHGKRKVIIEEMCDEIKRLKQKMEEIQKGNEEIEEETSVDSDEVESGSENGK